MMVFIEKGGADLFQGWIITFKAAFSPVFLNFTCENFSFFFNSDRLLLHVDVIDRFAVQGKKFQVASCIWYLSSTSTFYVVGRKLRSTRLVWSIGLQPFE